MCVTTVLSCLFKDYLSELRLLEMLLVLLSASVLVSFLVNKPKMKATKRKRPPDLFLISLQHLQILYGVYKIVNLLILTRSDMLRVKLSLSPLGGWSEISFSTRAKGCAHV